jgi:hypothetical protein
MLCISARINSCATKNEKQKQLKLVPLSLCRHLVIVAIETLPSEAQQAGVACSLTLFNYLPALH